jgi:hypothetical protein
MAVKAIEAHRRITSKKAIIGLWRPKKRIDQRVLSASCSPKTETAVLACFDSRPFSHTKKSDRAIRKYRVVQTGPKTQFGGVNQGLLKEAYQVGIEETVNTAPKRPAPWHKAIEASSLKTFEAIGNNKAAKE